MSLLFTILEKKEINKHKNNHTKSLLVKKKKECFSDRARQYISGPVPIIFTSF